MLEKNGARHKDIPLDLVSEVFNQEVLLLKRFQDVSQIGSKMREEYQFLQSNIKTWKGEEGKKVSLNAKNDLTRIYQDVVPSSLL